jgi:diguanylate cyclase (GGDEF)-like protein
LNPPSIQTVLTNLIALTNERDVFQLEQLLAQSLHDLIQPLSGKSEKSVVVYRAINVDKKLFNSVVIGKKNKESTLSDELKAYLANCFISGEFASLTTEHGASINLYPLKNTSNRTVAVIAIHAQIEDTQLHDTITMLLQIHQNFAGLISDNEHDTLTGLLNRKTFETKVNKVLEQMLKSAKRKDDKPNSIHFLALFDIDHFKDVNDIHGHLVGDDVLRQLSRLMKETFREKDLLFRYGGEEFLGIFECANAVDIKQLLERFMVKVSQFDFPKVGHVTISIGYTEIFTYDDASQLVSRADQALYFAKNNGRNRTCNFEQLIADGALQELKTENDLELL